MIIDSLENAGNYYGTHKLFARAFKLILAKNTSELPDGKYEIEGKRLFAIVSRNEGKGRKKARLERHKKYIDIQVSYGRDDVIGWKPVGRCVEAGRFSTAKDIGFFADAPEEWFRLRRGFFCVFFPEDAHAPLAGSIGRIHKLVVKVAAKI
jgi:YhcH/YjgK/YiaL family protein